ncbi:LacI family DNA-binding transcriptional regulator [Actinopolymorpha sp. B11F2]|uniref:LacI family DNA-binding transcriptional regulator n=1 Tax=Actinopolymorpha sp. B11F2 TaxID=3160862 RepID=UPI0032E3CEAD
MKALTQRTSDGGDTASSPHQDPAPAGDTATTDNADAGTGVTIYEVAARADVSIATVSRVLRGSSSVAPTTRRRVLDAVDDLRYTPSRLGRSLAERRHAAHGIVFPDLSGPYFAEVVLGYEEVAAELGRSVLILATHERPAARDMVLDLASRVDGMVVLGRTVDDDAVRHIAATGRRLVLLARPAVAGIDSITADNDGGARALVEHLVSHGHRRFTFLGDEASSPDTHARWVALREKLREVGVRPPSRPVRCPLDEEAGYEAAGGVLDRRGRTLPDVLVCANDEIALGALLAAEERGLAVPDDIAVTGWDDIMAARHARPALTTVRQPMRELGERAARLLHARVEGTAAAPFHDVLPTQLVVRTSCGSHAGTDTPGSAPRSAPGSTRSTQGTAPLHVGRTG